MLKHTLLAVPFLAALSVSAVAQEAPEPGPDALPAAIASALPIGWSVADVEIVAQINDGDAVDPRWRIRFEADLALAEPLYQADRAASEALRPFIVLIETQEEDTSRRLFGTARASFSAGQWTVDVAFENAPDRLGQPRDAFEGPTVLAGDDEIDDVRARLEAAEALTAGIEAEREERRIRIAGEMAALRAAQAAAETELDAAHQAGLRQLATRLDASEAEMRTRQDQALAELEASLDTTRMAMAAEIAAAEAEMTAMAERSVAALTARAEAAALSEETEALAALATAETERAAAIVALEEARAEALRTQAAARAASLAALRESLASDDPDARRLVLQDALTSGEPLLVRDALAFLLAGKPELALQYRKVGSDNTYRIQMLVIQEFEPERGTLTGQRSWNKGSTEFTATLLDSRLNFSDKDCKMTFAVTDAGALAGDMQCRNRWEAVIALQ